tara:strand:- start:102 stop:452 length:351 start_codon:yes stop_codon:yes gene_type:complete
MGYKLTGADFTAPTELGINVGEEVGQNLGQSIKKIGESEDEKTKPLSEKVLNTYKESTSNDESTDQFWKDTMWWRKRDGTPEQIDAIRTTYEDGKGPTPVNQPSDKYLIKFSKWLH